MCINYIKSYDEITLLKYGYTFKGSIIIFVLISTKVYGHFNDFIKVSGDKLKTSTTKHLYFYHIYTHILRLRTLELTIMLHILIFILFIGVCSDQISIRPIIYNV